MIKIIFVSLFLFSNLVFAQQNEIAKAKEFLQQKKYDDAIKILVKFYDVRAVASEVNTLLGEAYIGKNEIQSAFESYKKALDYDDLNMTTRAGYLSTLFRLKKFDLTQKFFAESDKIIKRKKGENFYNYYYEVGNIYFNADSVERAKVFYSKAKEENPNEAKVYEGLAECYLKQGVPSMAIDNYKLATTYAPNNAQYFYKLGNVQYKQRSYSEAVRSFNESIKIDPNNDLVILDLAGLYFRAKLWRDAASTFEKYSKLKPQNTSITEQWARSQYGARLYKESIVNFEKLDKSKLNQELTLMLAHSYYEAGDMQKSADMYNAIPIDSLKKTDDLINFGRSLVKLKDTTKALLMLEKATQIDTQSVEVAGELAAIFMAQKNFEKAVSQYNKILTVDQKNISALFYGGYAYSVLNQIDSAKNFFLKVTEIRPGYIQGRIFLMKMYLEQENYIEMQKESQIILKQLDSTALLEKDQKKLTEKINPIYLDVYRTLAIMEFKQKKYVQAVDNLKNALKYEPKTKKNESLHLFLAQMYNLGGDKESAKKEYDLVLKLNPKNASAKKERSQL
ncbi:MAG: tetratricopeptide repeat protein [Bacteroidota bacterium]